MSDIFNRTFLETSDYYKNISQVLDLNGEEGQHFVGLNLQIQIT